MSEYATRAMFGGKSVQNAGSQRKPQNSAESAKISANHIIRSAPLSADLFNVSPKGGKFFLFNVLLKESNKGGRTSAGCA